MPNQGGREPVLRVDVSKGLQVAGYHFVVKAGKHINKRLQEGNYYGRCYPKEKEILIDNSFSEVVVSNSIIHEIIHAVEAVFCNSSLKESQIRALANGLHQVVENLGIRFVASDSPGDEE